MTQTTANDISDTPHAIRLRRIRYRSWHRGCKETDVIMGNFADNALETLDTQSELPLYEALLDEQDVDIWNWITGKIELADGKYNRLKERLREFAKTV